MFIPPELANTANLHLSLWKVSPHESSDECLHLLSRVSCSKNQFLNDKFTNISTLTALFRVNVIKLEDVVGFSVKPQQTILLLKLICDK